MHNDLKEVIEKRMFDTRKSRRNMTTLHRVIKQSATEFPKEKVQQHINKLSDICEAILAKDGKRTKY